MKNTFPICALILLITVFAFGETKNNNLGTFDTVANDTNSLSTTFEVFSSYQTPYSFLTLSENASTVHNQQHRYSIYCRIHKTEAQYRRKEGYGRTCTKVYTHQVNVPYPGRSYDHELLVDCSGD